MIGDVIAMMTVTLAPQHDHVIQENMMALQEAEAMTQIEVIVGDTGTEEEAGAGKETVDGALEASVETGFLEVRQEVVMVASEALDRRRTLGCDRLL